MAPPLEAWAIVCESESPEFLLSLDARSQGGLGEFPPSFWARSVSRV